MLKFANKAVFKYLSILIFVIIISVVYLIGSNYVIRSFNQQLVSYMDRVHEDSSKILEINYELEKIQSNIFSLSAISNSQKNRNEIQHEIDYGIEKISYKIKSMKYLLDEENLKKVHLENTFSSEYLETLTLLHPLLENVQKENEQLIALLKKRDAFLKTHNKEIAKIAFSIRDFNAKIPTKIGYLTKLVLKAKSLHDINCKKLQIQIQNKRQMHWKVEMVLYMLGLFITLYIVRIISKNIVQLYESVERRLYTDELTGIASRYAFMQEMKNAIHPVVVLFDISKFKSINDLFGTKVGNEVLCKLAKLANEYAKKIDFEVYRLSADEFVFYKDIQNQEIPRYFDEVILGFYRTYKKNKIFLPTIADYIELEFASGIAHGKENVLSRADMALEYSKQNNLSYTVYSKEIDTTQSLQSNIFWKKEIQRGLEDDDFVPFFQPIVDRKQEIIRYESLARLRSEEDGKISFISPYKFLDIAIKTKNYNKISKMVIFKTLQLCKDSGQNVSINIAKQDILNEELLKELKEQILADKTAKQITFEILESEDIQNQKELKSFISEFKNIGVSFAIDDFGSGFSNFSFILSTSPKYIKIDGSLIKNIDSNKDSYELVKSIVAFSHALNKEVIAEFVHSKEVFEIAYSLDIDMFQGYYFSMPKEKL